MPVDKNSQSSARPQDDAKGSFAKGRRKSHNDGVISANPRVLSKNEDGDATFTEKGLSRKK